MELEATGDVIRYIQKFQREDHQLEDSIVAQQNESSSERLAIYIDGVLYFEDSVVLE